MSHDNHDHAPSHDEAAPPPIRQKADVRMVIPILMLVVTSLLVYGLVKPSDSSPLTEREKSSEHSPAPAEKAVEIPAAKAEEKAPAPEPEKMQPMPEKPKAEKPNPEKMEPKPAGEVMKPAPAAAAQSTETAAKIFADAKAAWDALQDYHCQIRSWNKLEGTEDLKILDFKFKKPQLARSLVVKGINEGSTVTRDGEGTMHGKKGGVLGLVVLTLKEDDNRIRNLRGKKFYQADWGTMLTEFGNEIARGWTLTRQPDEPFKESMCYVIQVDGKDENSAVTQDKFWIDQTTHIIRCRTQNEGDLKVNDAQYTDIELNPGLTDDLFTL